jgi:hypothetical protein
MTQALTAPVLLDPPNGATGVRLNSLSWNGTVLLQNDVYFGTSSPPPLVASNISAGFYLLPILDSCTTYYWKVVAKDSTGTASSPVFSFTTIPAVSLSPPYGRFAAAGGTGSISVTSPSACPWSAGGALITPVSPASGVGNAVLSYSVPANTSSSDTNYQIYVSDKVFLVRVAGAPPCTYSVSGPTYIDASNQSVKVSVTTGSGCTWTLSSSQSWLTVPGGSQTGSASVNVTAGPNLTNSGRSATLTVTGSGAVGSPITASITQRATSSTFADVPPDSPFFDAINLLGLRSITSGCGSAPLTYCPNTTITRGQMAVFIVRSVMGGDSFSTDASPHFTDVPPSHQFFTWIQKLSELGIANTCATGQFCPDSPVTRDQMAMFIIRARFGAAWPLAYPATPLFADVPSTHPFFSWIQKMGQIGITSGCTPTQYCPNDTVTRGQMAVFIMRGAFNQLLPVSTPVAVSITPSTGAIGQSVTVVIGLRNANFQPGLTRVDAGPGIVVSNVTVIFPTVITAQFDIGPGGLVPTAIFNPHSITVTTPGSIEATLPNGFRVQ